MHHIKEHIIEVRTIELDHIAKVTRCFRRSNFKSLNIDLLIAIIIARFQLRFLTTK